MEDSDSNVTKLARRHTKECGFRLKLVQDWIVFLKVRVVQALTWVGIASVLQVSNGHAG